VFELAAKRFVQIVDSVPHDGQTPCVSDGKTVFQSFFKLMTVQSSFVASMLQIQFLKFPCRGAIRAELVDGGGQ
jgi:hypothetical protein